MHDGVQTQRNAGEWNGKVWLFRGDRSTLTFNMSPSQVNHLSKRHPEMRIDDVPELTLPIIKPNRDYFCQYCDKVCVFDLLNGLYNPSFNLFNRTKAHILLAQVYKSASKRKAHILKNHPGAELPPSIRKLRPAGPGEPDPMLSTHTQLTGTIATAPVCCPHCAKQYSSKVSAQPPHHNQSKPNRSAVCCISFCRLVFLG